MSLHFMQWMCGVLKGRLERYWTLLISTQSEEERVERRCFFSLSPALTRLARPPLPIELRRDTLHPRMNCENRKRGVHA